MKACTASSEWKSPACEALPCRAPSKAIPVLPVAHPANRSSASPGFTLIELMIVLLIMSVMTGVMISEMTGTREDAILKASARKIIDVLNLASSRAVTLGQTHRVQFEPSKRKFEVRRKVHETGEGVGFVSLNDATGSVGEWDERIAMELPTPEPADNDEAAPDETRAKEFASINFYADGTADPMRIILRDRQDFEIVLDVLPASGRIKLNSFGRR